MKYTVEIDGGGEWWYKEGTDILHRIGGPARIKPNGNKFWVFEGNTHRIGGPAKEYNDGRVEYWIMGQQFSKERYDEVLKSLQEQVLDSLKDKINSGEIKL